MPRPSRHLDRALLAAGRRLFPAQGASGLSIRAVCQEAGVNPGMFHYHFKTRDAFLRALLQDAYEELFTRFRLGVERPDVDPVGRLRSAFRELGRFLRDHRALMARILGEALAGEPLVRAFLAANLPRHLGILAGVIAEGQAAGLLAPVPVPQALAFCAGAIALPILAGGEIAASPAEAGAATRSQAATLLANDALETRIELALAALARPPAPPPGRKTRSR